MIRARFSVSIITLALAASLSFEHAAAQETAPPASSPYAAGLDAELSGGGLTSDEASRRASADSPELESKRQELLEAGARVDRALAAYLPVATLKASYTRLSDPGNESLGNVVVAPGAPSGPLPAGAALANVPLALGTISNQYALQAELLVPISDYALRIAPARAAAENDRGARQQGLAGAARKVATEARLAYYTWLRARLAVVVAEQSVAQARSHRNDAAQRYEAGGVSSADVLRVESQLASAEQYLASSRDMGAIAEQRLRILIRAEPRETLRIGEDIRGALPAAPVETHEQLLAAALSARPEIRALDAAYRAQQHQVDIERAGALPRVDAFARAAYSNPNSRVFPAREEFRGSWEAGAQISWTISDAPGALAAGRGASSKAAAILAERRSLVDRVTDEVFSARRTLITSLSSVTTAERGLAAAEESYRVRRLLYQSGKATSVELMDAETELTRARLEALNARVEARVAAVKLEHAVGRPPARR